MATEEKKPSGPDLSAGIPAADLAEGAMLAGHIGDDEVLLTRQGGKLFALSAHCTHYHGPLADGLLVGETIRCPWHHAHFNLQTGEAIAAPALSPGDLLVGRRARRQDCCQKQEDAACSWQDRSKRRTCRHCRRGAAGFAAAEMLRRRGFAGSISMLSNDDVTPVDRPNLSKDYLAGNAPEDWVPLRGDDWYAENKIDLKLKTEVAALDAKGKELTLGEGSKVKFDKLLLATGAEPVRLPISRRRSTSCPHAAFIRRLPRHHRVTPSPPNAQSSSVPVSSASKSAAALRAPRDRGSCGGAGETPARARVRAAAR